MEFYDIMERAASNVGLELNEIKYNKFMLYKDLLKEWNEKINLTAITEDEDIVKKHFIDCIKAFKFEGFNTADSIIDVGTGAGFPGVPISIMKEDCNVLLMDSLNKRVNFLNEVISKLDLQKVQAVHGRAEEMSRTGKYREKYDIATSRAVANMCVLSEICIPYVKVGGYFVAMKGPNIEEELKESKNAISTLGGKLIDVIKVEIEDSDLNHNLVVVQKVKSTPNTFPRKYGSISKKPLK